VGNRLHASREGGARG